jgi:hypothetical protein
MSTRLEDREPTREQLARDVLSLADVGGMPDSYWQTDSRVTRARAVLGVGEDERYTKAEEWTPRVAQP